MELRPTEIQPPQTSEDGSLMKHSERDSDDAKTEQDYVNAAFHRENEVYENI